MNDYENYISTQEACELYKVSISTLRKWDREGKIDTFRTPGKQRRYSTQLFSKNTINTQSVTKISNSDITNVQKQKICYCRVSSSHQKNDLQRQKEFLQSKYPDYRIVQDIGSGINWKRGGLKTILELAMQNKLDTVVVAHKDRLCRFAFELVHWILESNNVKLVVLDESVCSTEQELAEDLLSIIHVFSCKQMGKRRYKKEENNGNTEN
jgi:excisionase family DNA binding protein